jgi:DNA-binding GntR family transcriptional regulator
VREALRDLATEGLVTQSPHRGAVVTALNVTDAIEINEIRLKLEPDAIADAAGVFTPAALQRVEDLYTMLSTASAGEWIALNREFHMYLIAQTPSSRVRSILTSLAGFAALYVGVAISHRHGAEPQQEHRAILDAITRNDAPAVRSAVAQHLQHSLTSLREAADDPAVIARVD